MRGTLHGTTGEFFLQQALYQNRLLLRTDVRDEDRAFLHRADHVQRGWLHGKNHIGVADQLLAILNEGDVFVRGIGELDRVSGARLHVKLRAELDQLGDKGGYQRHTPFVRVSFLQNGDVDVHEALQCSAAPNCWSDLPAKIASADERTPRE